MTTDGILVGTGALPADPRERDELLQDYFCERVAECEALPDGWMVRLTVPADPAMYVDPRLEEGLAWWGLDGLASIPFAHRRLPTHRLALNDAWTLLSWSEWLAGLGRENAPAEIVVLHVDDHDDLMSPRLVADADGYVDAITGVAVDLFEPDTVKAATVSGAIGMGSFVLPLVATVPVVHIRHLCATDYSSSRRGVWSMRTETRPDDLLAPGRPRPGIVLTPDAPETGTSTYQVAADPTEWLAGLPSAPTVLHVDMDYFNNRFNGDSDWMERERRHDPPWDDVATAIRRMFDALDASAFDQLAHVTVAISPGFFPAELWAPACSLVEEELGSSRLVVSR